MDKNIKTYYRSRDLAEVAALVVEGKSILKIERSGSICWFVFEDKESCEMLSNKYFFGHLLVDARYYFETITRLKNRIFYTME